jgi:hypothetical protein
MTEREAFELLIESYLRKTPDMPLRELCEKELPRAAKTLGVTGGYYELFIAVLELAAEEKGLDKLRFYSDRELLSAVSESREPQGAAV